MLSILHYTKVPIEQVILLNDGSQGQYYEYFKDKNVDTRRKKWLDLFSMSTNCSK